MSFIIFLKSIACVLGQTALYKKKIQINIIPQIQVVQLKSYVCIPCEPEIYRQIPAFIVVFDAARI